MDISSEEQTDCPILFVSDPKRHDFYRFSHLSGNTPFEPLFSPFPEKSPAQCPSHNRWNMEKLLLGFRKPTAEEEELIYGSKEMGDIFKKKRFVHPDIRPYDELKESSKAYDRCITAGIPLVVNNNT